MNTNANAQPSHDAHWQCVAPVGSGCGEGALWDAGEQALYWTDVTRFLLHRLTPHDGCVKSWFFAEPVVALSGTDRPGCLLVALGSRLLLWTVASDLRSPFGTPLADAPRLRWNEGRSGPDGRLWLGSMRNNVAADGSLIEAGGADGVLVSLDHSGRSTLQREGLGIANTLCWTPDRRRLIFGDSLANTLYCADCPAHPGAALTGVRTFFSGFERGLPDGSAMDAEGCLWNCRFGGGCIVRLAPDGQLLEVIEAPTQNPTTCVFGGPDYRTLYLTSARILTGAGDRLAGSCFALRTQVPGLPGFAFALGAGGA